MKPLHGTRLHKSQGPSVTGRDDYIMLQALAYAITAIEQRPERFQEWSNKEDMKLLLDHFCTNGILKRDLLHTAWVHLTGIGHPLSAGSADAHAA
jgi:hypothetical protein